MEETKKGMQRIADLGAIGDTIRTRIATLRESQNLSYAALSRLLEEAGRPIGTLALRRIEAGARRVDVDDLVALALVLGATPNSLMMDPKLAEGPTQDDLLADDDSDAKYQIELAPGVTASARAVWDWLDGRRPLWDVPNTSASAFEDRNRNSIVPPTQAQLLKEVWEARAVQKSVGDIRRRLEVIEEKLGVPDGND